MHAARIWLTASRPKTLIAGISPVLIGTTLSLSAGVFNPIIFLFTLLTAMGIQITANLANDYFDFIKGADKERKGPLRVMQAGLVSSRTMKSAIVLSMAMTFLLGTVLIHRGGFAVACLLVLALILALLYTAGPFPLAYIGLGDVFVLVFYGPVSVMGTYYLQTDLLTSSAFLAGIAPGCLSTAILVANNVRDVEEDRKAQKKTLPVRLGINFGKLQYISMILIALLPSAYFSLSHPFSALAFLILIPAIPLMYSLLREKKRDPAILNHIFVNTGKLLWMFTLLFCIGWML